MDRYYELGAGVKREVRTEDFATLVERIMEQAGAPYDD
jgi:hypothetical protein